MLAARRDNIEETKGDDGGSCGRGIRLVYRKPATAEATADEVLQIVRQQFAAANAEHSALPTQLEEIGGGDLSFSEGKVPPVRSFQSGRRSERKERNNRSLAKKRELAETALRAAQTEHEQLRKEEQDLAGKSSQLEQMVVDFLSAFERLAWGKTEEAVNGLRQWIEQMQSMPNYANPDAKVVDAETFEHSYQQKIAYLMELKNGGKGLKMWCKSGLMRSGGGTAPERGSTG